MASERAGMNEAVKIEFGAFDAPKDGTLVLFVSNDLVPLGPVGLVDEATQAALRRAAKAAAFKPKAGKSLEILAPAGLSADRLVILSLGSDEERAATDWIKTGGQAMAKLGSGGVVAFDGVVDADKVADAAADFALGASLRAYKFDRYKTKKDEDGQTGASRIVLGLADPAAAKKAHRARQAVGEGVVIARDLVNEPPNVLTPAEFAKRAEALAKLGVEVDVLDRKALDKLGMRALLGVSQGSANEPRVVIMRWNGAKKSRAPIAFVGKGVTFDTGGISIKPAAGMEDMKGDMGGAACVVGLMHALASRKAKVNAVGAIGLVENMPDGAAQRPGDIVTSMSGQTIEIINTDAEGRLVLADVLWHVQTKFKPVAMIDLATLTGAILVALAQEHAGLFANDDALAAKLEAAGKATGETVWRMPMGPAFDKMIDSKFADMKNSAGRNGGSSTAAQFLKRYVGETPWAHLDIAGVGMGSPQTDLNQSWGSGWGVRLLDRLVSDAYEG
jgi:leucyl aminopeptidase